MLTFCLSSRGTWSISDLFWLWGKETWRISHTILCGFWTLP